jgi:anti-sigma regulatory factor (Ser/Thr protein kinase)
VCDSCFRHELLPYADGVDGFLVATLPLIRPALAAEEQVLIAVGADRIDGLKEALEDDAERVGFTDMRSLGSNPARIIPAWHAFVEQAATAGGHPLGIGEPVWPGRSAAELMECERHESLLDVAFAGGAAWQLVCPYDLDRLEDQVIEAAYRTHSLLAHDGESNGFHHEHNPPSPFEGFLPSPVAGFEELAFGREELAALRRFVSGWANEAALPTQRTEELVLAINELATNSIRYGGGGGRLRLWREADTLMCEIQDGGHIVEPLAGRRRPKPEEPSGRGLWLVNQLCDLVQIRSSAHAGSRIRVHMHLS